MNKENAKDFIKFLIKREEARLCKEKGIPFTKDNIISKYRFTNVNKWDDKTSKLFIERAMQSENPWAEAFVTIHFPYEVYKNMPIDTKELISFLRNNVTKRTPAYLLSGEPFEQVMCRMADFIEEGDFSVSTVKELKGVGDFILNQYVSNVRKLDGLYQDFFLPGPGTKKGFKLIFERDYKTKEDILLVKGLLIRNLPPAISKYYTEDINNVGNALCEYSKYYALSRGKGRSRRYESKRV